MVTSSSIAVADSQHIGAFYFLKKHLLFLSLGAVLATFAMRTELKLLEKHAYLLPAGAVAAGAVVVVAALASALHCVARKSFHFWPFKVPAVLAA